MSTRVRQRIGYSTLVLMLLAFIVAVMASNVLLRGWRIDLTKNQLYTLSPGTRNVLQKIDEPINLYLFFSNQETQGLPAVRAYATRVTETLQEFAAKAPKGKLVLHVVDPIPFSEDEDRAEQFGLQAAMVGDKNIYFGLAGSNSVGTTDTIPFFDPEPSKEAFLEYDLARLVYNLANPKKTVIGLLSGAPIGGSFDPQTQQPTQPWVIVEQARQVFDLRMVPESTLKIDDDINVLWVVHPAMLDDATQYAIDQFVMRGGHALIFVDPMAEILATQQEPGLAPPPSSTLDKLFKAWGVEFSTMDVVADNRYALGIRQGQKSVRHVGLLGLDMDAMSKDDVITSGLGTVNVGLAGYFKSAEGATSKLTPLLQSSTEAETLPVMRFQFLPDPGELLNGFKATGMQYTIAARLQGPLKSAFPDGPPKPAEGKPSEGRDAAVDDKLKTEHKASTDNANLVLVGDVDMLSDRLWAQVQNFLGQRLVNAFANNGDFVINALDNLSGSADLIGLRSRATFSRPFTTVDKLRRDADAKFRETEKELQAELSDTERKLGELQAGRNDKSSMLMNSAQQDEIQRFLGEQVRIRQQLRSVRHELDQDINNLGTMLKVINIIVMPIVLIGLLLLVAAVRRRGKAAR
ncbi:MAG TPA: Gldg family protein [Gammaproteobacteria bacterium]|nr:Gldg family protein [Gammaproteobacteria bacterium]